MISINADLEKNVAIDNRLRSLSYYNIPLVRARRDSEDLNKTKSLETDWLCCGEILGMK